MRKSCVFKYRMYRVRTTVSLDQFLAFFDTLELTYTLIYALRRVQDLP